MVKVLAMMGKQPIFFLSDLEMIILRSIKYGYRTGSLSITQKRGIITYIPKPNKSRQYLKNWRPISFLSPVLTVPVWPRFTPVEDSRYTVINRDTFPKKINRVLTVPTLPRWCPGLRESYPRLSLGSPRSNHGAARCSPGSCRYGPVLPRLCTVMPR